MYNIIQITAGKKPTKFSTCTWKKKELEKQTLLFE
jgi:hypothetical protein